MHGFRTGGGTYAGGPRLRGLLAHRRRLAPPHQQLPDSYLEQGILLEGANQVFDRTSFLFALPIPDCRKFKSPSNILCDILQNQAAHPTLSFPIPLPKVSTHPATHESFSKPHTFTPLCPWSSWTFAWAALFHIKKNTQPIHPSTSLAYGPVLREFFLTSFLPQN